MKKLSRNEMKILSGGIATVLTCTCSGPFGQSNVFRYMDYTPENYEIAADINRECSSGSASCIYALP